MQKGESHVEKIDLSRYVLLFALNYCLPSTTVCPQLLHDGDYDYDYDCMPAL